LEAEKTNKRTKERTDNEGYDQGMSPLQGNKQKKQGLANTEAKEMKKTKKTCAG